MFNKDYELTLKSILLTITLSIILSAANTYLGLFAGMTVSASIPAAIISTSILRLFKKSNILENNLVQTSASAGESLAAGVIFTFPALLLLGYWNNFDYVEVSKIALMGGLLGVIFTIPLRKTLIIKKKLTYPEGIATSKILKSRENLELGKIILQSSLLGGLFKFLQQGLNLWKPSIEYIFRSNKSIFGFACDLSPALLGVGYIIGLNVGILILSGGIVSWLIAIPLYTAFNDIQGNVNYIAWDIWNTKIRFLGVGAMLIGGFWSILKLFKPIIEGIILDIKDYKKNINTEDLSIKFISCILAIIIIPLFFMYFNILNSFLFSIVLTLLIIIIAFFFSSVAAYMSGIVGSSNNPVSGITIATILLSALFIKYIGFQSEIGMISSILFGAIVCCSAAIGGDNMQDLKTGYIIGATPWKQQIMQIIGVTVSAITITFTLNVLHSAYTIGSEILPAPQANLMKVIVEAVFNKNLPWNWIYTGIIIGFIIIVIDEFLEHRKANFRMPVLAVAVGIYLPIGLSVPIFLGSLVSYINNNERGILFASGLITGEAIMGIIIAIPIFITGINNWWANNTQIIAVIVFLLILIQIYRQQNKTI